MMRVPWRRGRGDVPPAPDVENTVRKLAESKRDLEQTKAETAYYRGLGSALRAIRRENHLAETFLAAANAHGQGGRSND